MKKINVCIEGNPKETNKLRSKLYSDKCNIVTETSKADIIVPLRMDIKSILGMIEGKYKEINKL